MERVIWIRFTEDATEPRRGTAGSAGYDLYSTEEFELQSGERRLIKTGVGVILPKGTYGRIAPRSSLAYKMGIDVLAGVIDRDYREPIGVILYNTSKETQRFKRGERIAQLIIERCYLSNEVESEFLDKENAKACDEWNTDREGGFGSTGK